MGQSARCFLVWSKTETHRIPMEGQVVGQEEDAREFDFAISRQRFVIST